MKKSSMMTKDTLEKETTPNSCQVCGKQMGTDIPTVFCRDCGTPHHVDCWLYTRKCSTYGCECTTYSETPTQELHSEVKNINDSMREDTESLPAKRIDNDQSPVKTFIDTDSEIQEFINKRPLFVHCQNCNTPWPVTEWKKNNGCLNENCGSQHAILLASRKARAVSISTTDEITVTCKSKFAEELFLYTTVLFIASIAISTTGIFSYLSFLAPLFGLYFFSLTILQILMIVLNSVTRTKLILNPSRESMELKTILFGLVVSETKDFRRMDDFIELQLKITQCTQRQFAEYCDLCSLPGNGIPPLVFECNLLCDDHSVIRLFDFIFNNGEFVRNQDTITLVTNKDEPHSFLSILRTAKELGRILDIPVRMIYKDTVVKGANLQHNTVLW